MAKSVTEQMNKILRDYNKEVISTTNDVYNNVGKETSQKLKSSSLKRTGQYAKAWTMKTEKGGSLKTNHVIVHNKRGQLTYLLENGHVISNGRGEYGRTPGIKHISPVNDWAIDEALNRIKRELR